MSKQEMDIPQLKEDLAPILIEKVQQQWPVRPDGDGFLIGNTKGEPGKSMRIYPDAGYHDFAAGENGDALSLLALLEGLSIDHDFTKVLQRARELTGHTSSANSATPSQQHPAPAQSKPTPKPAAPELAPDALEQLAAVCEAGVAALQKGESVEAQAAREYLASRGLPVADTFGVIDATVKTPANMGYNLHGRLLIIYRDEAGRATHFNARALTGKKEDRYRRPLKDNYPRTTAFNAARALGNARKHGLIILTEGEIDAASLLVGYGSNHPVIGCTAGTLPDATIQTIARTGYEVLILADNDDGDGQRIAESLREKIHGYSKASKVHIATLPGVKDANEALQKHGAQGLVSAVEEALELARTASISDYHYLTTTWLAEINARANRKYAHYSTGLPALDELLGGGYLEGLHLLGGITAGGKTSLALHIAMHNARQGRPVVYGSYEQSKLELWARIANRLTGVPQTAIKAGWYTYGTARVPATEELQDSPHWAELEQLSKYLKIVEGGDALSRQQGVWSVEELRNVASEATKQRGAPPLIIIDYLQRMPLPAELNIKDVRERVGAVAGALQTQLARELGAPVLALSSVGRASYKAKSFAQYSLDERLTAFKEAGELEYTAYTATLLYALPESKQGRIMTPTKMIGTDNYNFTPRTLDVVKNREGSTGRVAVKWEPHKDYWHEAHEYGAINELL